MLAALAGPARSARAIFALAPLLFAVQAVAAPITVPPSLASGAQYRLAFVTAGYRNATSSSIAVYDSFVQGQAYTEAALTSISWQAIGSTASVTARDHTGTAPADGPGVPIFLLNGVKLVDDYEDLWNGDIDVALLIDQHGNIPASINVWTGSYSDGTAAGVLGNLNVTFGRSNRTDRGWISAFGTSLLSQHNLYALSAVLTVPVPEPDLTSLLALGVAALLLLRVGLARAHATTSSGK